MPSRAVSHWILPRKFQTLNLLLAWLISLQIFNSTVLCLLQPRLLLHVFDQFFPVCNRSSKTSPLASFFLDMLQVVRIKQKDLHPRAFFWWWFWQSAGPCSPVLFSPRVGSRGYLRKSVRNSGGLKRLRVSSGFLSCVGNTEFCRPKDDRAVLCWERRILEIES